MLHHPPTLSQGLHERCARRAVVRPPWRKCVDPCSLQTNYDDVPFAATRRRVCPIHAHIWPSFQVNIFVKTNRRGSGLNQLNCSSGEDIST